MKNSGDQSVENAKKFINTDKIAECLLTMEPGHGYMEVSFGPKYAKITKVEYREENEN